MVLPSSQLSASEWEEKKVGERKNRAGEKVLQHDFFIRLHSLLLTLELWSLWDLHNRQWERLSGSSSREEGELCVLKCSVDWIMCKNYLDVWLHTEALSRRQQQIWKLLTLLQMSVHSYLTLGFQLKLQNGLQIEWSVIWKVRRCRCRWAKLKFIRKLCCKLQWRSKSVTFFFWGWMARIFRYVFGFGVFVFPSLITKL